MGLSKLGHALEALPRTWQEAERWLLQRLGLPQAVWADYMEAVLLTVNGWTSWCAYLSWWTRLESRADNLYASYLPFGWRGMPAWNAILLEYRSCGTHSQTFTALQSQWGRAPALLKQAEEVMLVEKV